MFQVPFHLNKHAQIPEGPTHGNTPVHSRSTSPVPADVATINAYLSTKSNGPPSGMEQLVQDSSALPGNQL